MEEMTIERATEFFSQFYGGEHHIPDWKPKRFGYGWSVNHDRGSLATFDFNELTRLVIMAHDACIRVEVSAVRNGILRIAIWQRVREGSISLRHPTLEHAIENFRRASNRKPVTGNPQPETRNS